MVLQDLLDNLATGEFANLSLANSTVGSIKEEAYPRIIRAINRSLLEIYKPSSLSVESVYRSQAGRAFSTLLENKIGRAHV